MLIRLLILLVFTFYNGKALCYSVFSYDITNNETILAKDELAKIYPASTTKIMTGYLAIDALDSGAVGLYDRLKISKKAANQPNISAKLPEGSEISLKYALLLSSILSANDAAYAISEYIEPELENFVAKMNAKAVSLKLYNTNFANPTGLHSENQYSTAQDIALLLLAINREYPGYMGIFNSNGIFFNGKLYTPRNPVAKNYKCIKSHKTGFTNAAGYNIAVYLSCESYNLVLTGMKFQTALSRDAYLVQMLEYSMQKIGSMYHKNDKHFYFQADNAEYGSYAGYFLLANARLFQILAGKNSNSITQISDVLSDVWSEKIAPQFKPIINSALPVPVL